MGFVYEKAAPEEKKRMRIELSESLAQWVEELAEKNGDTPSQVLEAIVRFAMKSGHRKTKKSAKIEQSNAEA